MSTTKTIQLQSLYSDPEFEAVFEALEKDLLVFDLDAKQKGSQNKPVTFKEYKIGVITPIKTLVQKVIDFNYSRNQVISDMAIAQSLRATAVDDATDLLKDKNEKEKKLVPLRDELKSLKEKCKTGLSTTLRFIIPALFGLCEGGLVYNMLSSSSLPFMMSFFLALLTALVAGFGLHLGANFICKARTIHIKRIRYAIVLAISFAVAGALGVWRAHSYSEASSINSQLEVTQAQPAVTPSDFSPWPFILLSFFSFVVALAFEIKYWLSDENKSDIKKYEDKTKEVKKEEQAILALKSDIDSIKANSNSDSAFIIRRQEYACTNEERCLSLSQHKLGNYESINGDFRKDGQCPDFFGEPVDFGFKLYFLPLFNSLKQKK